MAIGARYPVILERTEAHQLSYRYSATAQITIQFVNLTFVYKIKRNIISQGFPDMTKHVTVESPSLQLSSNQSSNSNAILNINRQ